MGLVEGIKHEVTKVVLAATALGSLALAPNIAGTADGIANSEVTVATVKTKTNIEGTTTDVTYSPYDCIATADANLAGTLVKEIKMLNLPEPPAWWPKSLPFALNPYYYTEGTRTVTYNESHDESLARIITECFTSEGITLTTRPGVQLMADRDSGNTDPTMFQIDVASDALRIFVRHKRYVPGSAAANAYTTKTTGAANDVAGVLNVFLRSEVTQGVIGNTSKYNVEQLSDSADKLELDSKVDETAATVCVPAGWNNPTVMGHLEDFLVEKEIKRLQKNNPDNQTYARLTRLDFTVHIEKQDIKKADVDGVDPLVAAVDTASNNSGVFKVNTIKNEADQTATCTVKLANPDADQGTVEGQR